MAVTVSEGFPDYLRVDTRAFKPFLNTTTDTGGSQYRTGKFYVGNFPTLIVQLQTTGTSVYSAAVQWFSDSTDTTPMLSYNLVFANNSSYQVGHAILGPWVEIVFSPVSYVTGDIVGVVLTPTSNLAPMSQMIDTYVVQETSHVVAANSSSYVQALGVAPGPGILTLYNPASPKYLISIQAMTVSGVWESIFTAYGTATAAAYDYQVTLPPKSVRIQMENADAASSHSFDFTLSLRQ